MRQFGYSQISHYSLCKAVKQKRQLIISWKLPDTHLSVLQIKFISPEQQDVTRDAFYASYKYVVQLQLLIRSSNHIYIYTHTQTIKCYIYNLQSCNSSDALLLFYMLIENKYSWTGQIAVNNCVGRQWAEIQHVYRATILTVGIKAMWSHFCPLHTQAFFLL